MERGRRGEGEKRRRGERVKMRRGEEEYKEDRRVSGSLRGEPIS